MSSDKIQDLISKSIAYASDNYGAPPDFNVLLNPRLIPEQYFGFSRGEMPVIRVAGGRAQDALRSLLVLEAALGLGQIIIVHHTDCGMMHLTDAGIKAFFKEKCPHKSADLDAMDFDAIVDGDLQKSVRTDIGLLKESPYFSKDLVVTGMIFDMNTGKVQMVN
ncbi:carbonic anhydrase [Mycena maculata]|uniref:Carbonic anhydrase n=1 Tax=Mycena maculata TaxID=230809 RepID=A0AAD7ICD6_9AGAR|nr:carbonic anhydrase [Mycena maculata]